MAKENDRCDSRASPLQLTAQEQLSARPSPRLHPSASMPNIWMGQPNGTLVTRAPTRPRLLPDSAHHGQVISPLGITHPNGHTNDARAPGQPLTPPMSPNGPTSQYDQGYSSSRSPHQYSLFRSQQQQAANISPISPFRTTTSRFDPFASHPSMLPSPPHTVRQEDTQQSSSVQNGHEDNLNSPFRVQFPRTEHPTMSSESDQDGNSTDSQATLVSPLRPQRVRPQRPISILDSDGGIQRAGRLLLVSNVPRDTSEEDLKNAFATLGDLKGLYIRFLRDEGKVIIAFYDMREAASARYHMRIQRFFKEGVHLQTQFISPAALSQYFGPSFFVDVGAGEVYISTMGQGNLNQAALANVLAAYGHLRQFRVIGTHGKAFFAEFFDTRDADEAVRELDNRHAQGVILRLTHRQPPPMLDLTTLTTDPALTIADFQRQQDEFALFQHHRQIVEASLRDEEQANILCARTPDGGDIARGGPFDASVGTLGRRGSFPGSSPRIDEREERFASFTDSNVFGSPLDGHGEFERERKRSNIYGADHHKAIIPSYPSPRTPSRITSHQISSLVSPKKLTLPPYSGPLPAPKLDDGGSMTWPLPLRLPTPPLSASTTFSGGSSGADSPEFFIPTQTPPRRQGRVVHGTPGAQAAHAYLPAAARSVLEVLREPPPERNKLDLNRIREGLDTRTTVMLKNVPNKMTDKHLMAFIDTVTPKSYSFLYLRMDFENHCNVGYAFVNFMDVDSLLRFAETKLGKKWGMFNSEKVLNMSYANYQGKEALVEKFRNSGVMEEREAWRPKIFYSSGPRMGELEPFPLPNNHLRQQRSFQNGRTQGLYSSGTVHSSNYGLAAL